MRPLELTCEDVHLTGVAAATSYLHDIQHSHYSRPHFWGSDAAHDLMDMLSVQPNGQSWRERRATIAGDYHNFGLDVPVAPEVEGVEQFKATFDEVKADLAETCRQSLDKGSRSPSEIAHDLTHDSSSTSPKSTNSKKLPSRSHIIRSKIRDLDSRITALRAQLDADSRCIRNIAALTPFQKSTRSRLFAAIQNMAKRVMQVRLDMERLTCHRFVLHRDLISESRLWEHSKQFALRSAKETLQSKYTIPRMTLSLHDDRLSFNSQHESGQHDDRNSHDVPSEENEEQAEEWNQTRCGHRVSLVHIPSDISDHRPGYKPRSSCLEPHLCDDTRPSSGA